ncbi:ROK family transcriptional regulator [Protaetiibacter mangrovi]|uniref:ROK family transcriptional regulator n=1 Tax=Protaetiibacter mangrovi TaxID=2970926 RepID=A0ABT1ZC98_9MICO|nr:ROK family transcriptional regulator [Protaetiibacter mangrovi]MCS0498337.1 ROK family transcriptional regulator [Protaetiibacter mangrovi]TPX02695.1 ROK family transcriptional regulator [Schumannella luteola]
MADQRRTPGSQTSLREANRGRIVDAVKKHGGLTQVELAGATGLSPATVSNIVKELSESGVLSTSKSMRSGRRAQYVTLAHASGLVCGIHFSQRHLRVALADATLTVVSEHEMPLARDHRSDNEIRRVGMLLSDMLDTVSAERDELLAVGVAVSAPMDAASGMVARPGILRGWEGIAIADAVERALRVPVLVDNSSNLSAFAEHRLGALRGQDDAMFLEVSDGIGAGIIMGGRGYRGASGSAGEFGHMVIVENGPLCRCGNLGCLEAIAGGDAILGSLKNRYPGLKLGDVIVRAMAGDDACIRAIADAGTHIGVAAANVASMFDPIRMVVGGHLARAGELLLGPIRQVVDRSLASRLAPAPEIVAGQLGPRAALMGALGIAADRSSTFPVVSVSPDLRTALG